MNALRSTLDALRYNATEALRELGPPAARWLATRVLGSAIAAAVQLGAIVGICWVVGWITGK